jgi:hypothetical protein
LGNGMRNPRCPEFRGVQDSVGAGSPRSSLDGIYHGSYANLFEEP